MSLFLPLLFIAVVAVTFPARAAAECPLTSPCNCDPAYGWRAFNHTCVVKWNVAANECANALERAGVDVAAQIEQRTRVESGFACDRTYKGGCVTVVVNVSVGTDGDSFAAWQQMSFCTGVLYNKDDQTTGTVILYMFLIVIVGLPALGCGLAIAACVVFAVGSAMLELSKLVVKACVFARKMARDTAVRVRAVLSYALDAALRQHRQHRQPRRALEEPIVHMEMNFEVTWLRHHTHHTRRETLRTLRFDLRLSRLLRDRRLLRRLLRDFRLRRLLRDFRLRRLLRDCRLRRLLRDRLPSAVGGAVTTPSSNCNTWITSLAPLMSRCNATLCR